MYKVFVLTDPDTPKIHKFYGSTAQPIRKRAMDLVAEAKFREKNGRDLSSKELWILSIVERGIDPHYILLGEYGTQDEAITEVCRLSKLSKTCLNTQAPGSSAGRPLGSKDPAETYSKKSKAKKKYYKTHDDSGRKMGTRWSEDFDPLFTKVRRTLRYPAPRLPQSDPLNFEHHQRMLDEGQAPFYLNPLVNSILPGYQSRRRPTFKPGQKEKLAVKASRRMYRMLKNPEFRAKIRVAADARVGKKNQYYKIEINGNTYYNFKDAIKTEGFTYRTLKWKAKLTKLMYVYKGKNYQNKDDLEAAIRKSGFRGERLRGLVHEAKLQEVK